MVKERPKIISRSDASATSPIAAKIQKIIRAIAFIPLAVLFLERLWIPFEGPTSGYLHVQDVASTTTVKKKATHTATTATTAKTSSLIQFPEEYPLQRITRNYRLLRDYSCPKGTLKLSNVVVPLTVGNSKTDTPVQLGPKSIPNIIHIAVDNKCATPKLYESIDQWKQLDNWSIYIHDEEAMTRLLKLPEVATEFPQLSQILRNCVLPQHDSVSLEKLWKYLVLYIYGGVYTSMDLVPTIQFRKERLNDRDAVVAMPDGKESTMFIMAPPRHPLLFYALHHVLQGLVSNGDGVELVKAFRDFQGGATGVAAGTYKGIDKHSVTFIDLNGAGDSQMVKRGEGNIVAEKKAPQQQATASCNENILMEILDVAKARQ